MQLSPGARRWTYPIVAVVAAAVAGDGLALPLGRAGLVEPVVATALTVGFLAAVVFARRRLRPAALALLAFGVCLARADGVYRPHVGDDDVAALVLPALVFVEGEIEQPPQRRAGGVRLSLALQRIGRGGAQRPVRGRLLLSIRHAEKAWRRGDVVRGEVRLRRPRNFGNPGEFDYEAHLARRGVGVTGFVFADAVLERVAGSPPNRREAWRAGVAALFERRADGPASDLLKALLLGMASDLPPGMREGFARAGVSHILAISGLHIGLVAAVAYGTFRWLLARSERLLLRFVVPKLAAALALVPVLLYAGIAGSNVATGRAVAMAGLVLGAILLDRQANLVVALALVAAAMVAAEPGVTAEISFQLSFVAVAALLAATEQFRGWWNAWSEREMLRLRPRRAWLLRGVFGYAAVSLAALLSTTPLVAFHFNRVSLAAPLANLVVTPILGTLVVPLGLLAALTQPVFEPLAALFVDLAAPLARLGIGLVEIIAAAPGASLRVATPSAALLVAIYAAMAGGLLVLGEWRRRVLVAAACTVVMSIALPWLQRSLSSEMRVTFLSVGQGDSAVVEFPDGRVVVVDGGGLGGSRFDVGERLIAPFLWSRGITRVDVLVATHPQWDHYGGLIFLVEEFAPREVWTNGATAATEGWRRFASAVAASAVPWVEVERGFRRRFGAADVAALGPPGRDRLGVNDASLVMALEYGGRRVLLAGDVEAAGEAALLEVGESLRSAVVKVPHHGSATSSSSGFVAAVAPEVAVVSAGRGNRFGFPRREVVNRYRRVAAKVVETGRSGAITVIVDGRGGYRLRAWRGGEMGIDSM